MISYINGNYKVTVYEDGTKVRESVSGVFNPEYPESIDLKITNKCDIGCAWCHEESGLSGEHADFNKILQRFDKLPAGIEVAIGGGNPLYYPKLVKLLNEFKSRGFISNITLNAKHVPTYKSVLQHLKNDRLLYGIGISYDGSNFFDTQDAVYHIIAGIHSFEDIQNLLHVGRKVLVLGYKSVGRGLRFLNEDVITKIRDIRLNLWKVLGKGVISFDNLAIEQLAVKGHFTESGWKRFYMGDDGHFTMYYDAVKDEFAISSISRRRSADKSIHEFFKHIRSEV